MMTVKELIFMLEKLAENSPLGLDIPISIAIQPDDAQYDLSNYGITHEKGEGEGEETILLTVLPNTTPAEEGECDDSSVLQSQT